MTLRSNTEKSIYRFCASLFVLLMTFAAYAQIQSVNLIVSPNLPPTPNDWLKNSNVLRVIILHNGNPLQIKVNARVTRGGTEVIRSNNSKSKLVTLINGVNTFTIDDLYNSSSLDVNGSQVNLVSGKINPGDYQVCITIIDPSNFQPIAPQQCRIAQVTEFQEPYLLAPADRISVFEDAAPGLVFQWMRVTPNYSGSVEYVFQLFEKNSANEPDYVAIQRIPVVNVLTRNTIYNWTNARQIISHLTCPL